MGKNLYIFNFKKIPKAFLSATTVILILNVIELFVLPINAFTFRPWEALVVERFHSVLPGPFYPNMELTMIAEGGLGHHTEYAVGKKVKWITDRYGYRKRNENVDIYEIVVIGDSHVAGAALTQDDMYSEQLERSTRFKVYPLAPASINTFLNSSRFKNNPPDIVIFEIGEHKITRLPDVQVIENDAGGRIGIKSAVEIFFRKNQRLAVLCDRISKRIMLRYFVKTISSPKKRLPLVFKSFFPRYSKMARRQKQPKILFLETNVCNNISQKKIDEVVQRIKRYKEALNERGIRFIFFPMPEKENIYWKKFALKKEPVFLQRLIHRLKKEEVEVIDVEMTFKKASEENGVLFYHTDDTHWNAAGVGLAVEVTKKLLKTKKGLYNGS